jgi:hypothetical protein
MQLARIITRSKDFSTRAVAGGKEARVTRKNMAANALVSPRTSQNRLHLQCLGERGKVPEFFFKEKPRYIYIDKSIPLGLSALQQQRFPPTGSKNQSRPSNQDSNPRRPSQIYAADTPPQIYSPRLGHPPTAAQARGLNRAGRPSSSAPLSKAHDRRTRNWKEKKKKKTLHAGAPC